MRIDGFQVVWNWYERSGFRNYRKYRRLIDGYQQTYRRQRAQGRREETQPDENDDGRRDHLTKRDKGSGEFMAIKKATKKPATKKTAKSSASGKSAAAKKKSVKKTTVAKKFKGVRREKK